MSEETQLKCTCNDGEFYEAVCPIHGSQKIDAGYNRGETIINDGYLISEHPVNIQGLLFQCPVCKTDIIFANSQYIPKLCCECGTSLRIQSKVFTESVRKKLT